MGWGSRLALAAVVGPLFLSPRPDLCISNVIAVECSVLQYPIPNAQHYVLRPSCFLTTSYVPGTSLESTTKHGEMPTCNIDSGSESRRGTIASLLPSGRFVSHFVGFVFVDNVDDRSQRLLRKRPHFLRQTTSGVDGTSRQYGTNKARICCWLKYFYCSMYRVPGISGRIAVPAQASGFTCTPTKPPSTKPSSQVQQPVVLLHGTHRASDSVLL